MFSPSGTPEKGDKVPEKQADGIDEKRRRQNTKEMTAKPWIADGKTKNPPTPLYERERWARRSLHSLMLGEEKLS
jgi:hypothetical protein